MTISATGTTTEALEAYDAMMVECVVKIEKLAPLALKLWSDALNELDGRGRVSLQHGSYDDPCDALITRTRG